MTYLVDIGTCVGAEEVVIQTFRNNNILLPKVSQNISKEGNLVRVVLE
jgi:hypothetical protein